jgi:hypothetical protein
MSIIQSTSAFAARCVSKRVDSFVDADGAAVHIIVDSEAPLARSLRGGSRAVIRLPVVSVVDR